MSEATTGVVQEGGFTAVLIGGWSRSREIRRRVRVGRRLGLPRLWCGASGPCGLARPWCGVRGPCGPATGVGWWRAARDAGRFVVVAACFTAWRWDLTFEGCFLLP